MNIQQCVFSHFMLNDRRPNFGIPCLTMEFKWFLEKQMEDLFAIICFIHFWGSWTESAVWSDYFGHFLRIGSREGVRMPWHLANMITNHIVKWNKIGELNEAWVFQKHLLINRPLLLKLLVCIVHCFRSKCNRLL